MADILPQSCVVVTKSGNLNFLKPSGPLQAFNGTALPLPLHAVTSNKKIFIIRIFQIMTLVIASRPRLFSA